MTDNTQNAYILTDEPLSGYMPAEVRQWLLENTKEIDLAEAFTQVSNKVGILLHTITEINDVWLAEAFDKWDDLEHELYIKIITILEDENKEHQASHKTTGVGLHYIVLPFMERNGYRDGAGWWIRNELNDPS